jgi:hypothetical protein
MMMAPDQNARQNRTKTQHTGVVARLAVVELCGRAIGQFRACATALAPDPSDTSPSCRVMSATWPAWE